MQLFHQLLGGITGRWWGVFFSTQMNRYHAMRCPSESCWFKAFIKGLRVRIGNIIKQDKAYSIEVVKALLTMYEQERHRVDRAMSMIK